MATRKVLWQYAGDYRDAPEGSIIAYCFVQESCGRRNFAQKLCGNSQRAGLTTGRLGGVLLEHCSDVHLASVASIKAGLDL